MKDLSTILHIDRFTMSVAHFIYQRPEDVLSREVRQTGSFSSGYGHDKIEHCPEGIPVEQAVFAILAAFAAAFAALFRALTQATMAAAGGRKKRAAGAALELPFYEAMQQKLADLTWMGRD